MKKVVFLDRDGTLTLDTGYTHQISDYHLLPGVKNGLKRLADIGFEFIIITNQSGIGRGKFNEDDYQKFTNHLIADLASSGISMIAIFYCPHAPEQSNACECRKPAPGLFHAAARVHGPINYAMSWAVGDSLRDVTAAKAAHPALKTILVPKNFDSDEMPEKTEQTNFIARDFFEVVKIITEQRIDV